MSEEEAYNYVDLKYAEDEDLDDPQPNTSRGNAQAIEVIKTTQNPYYCGDSVEFGENGAGNTKATFK